MHEVIKNLIECFFTFVISLKFFLLAFVFLSGKLKANIFKCLDRGKSVNEISHTIGQGI